MQAAVRRLLRTETNSCVSFSAPEPPRQASPSLSALRSLISSKSFASLRSSWSFSSNNDAAKSDKNDLAFTVRTPSSAWTFEQIKTLVGFMVSVPALSECSQVAVQKLACSVRGSLHNRHAQIWKADSPADFVYIVVSGSVRVTDEYAADGASEDGGSAMGGEARTESEDGDANIRTQELYVVEPRALLGVEEVHACCRRVAQAEAVEEGTLLLRIPADAYLRSLSNATIGQFTAKVDFLSSQGLLGCMGREAILKLAPCFTYGMVQAGTVLARQGEHCDKLLLIDLGTCTLMFDPTLAARAQALTSISQQTRGLSPTLPDRLGAVPSHSHGHTQSFTGGFHSHNNKAEADLRASEALLTLGPGSLVGDACVLLGQAQMVVSAVATTDVALYAVAGGAFVRRLGAEARQSLRLLADARAGMLAQLAVDMAARHSAMDSDAHTAGLRSRVLHGRDLRQLDLLTAAQTRGSRQAGAITPDLDAASAIDVTALHGSAYSEHLKVVEHGRGKTLSNPAGAGAGNKYAAQSSVMGSRSLQSQSLTQQGRHVTDHSANCIIPLGGSSGGHSGPGAGALAGSSGIPSSGGNIAALPSVQAGKAASALDLLDRLEDAAPHGAYTRHTNSQPGSTTHISRISHTSASGLGYPGATAGSTGGYKAGPMLSAQNGSGHAGPGSNGAAAAALSPSGRASSVRALISPSQVQRTSFSEVSSSGGQVSASSAYSLSLTTMLHDNAGVAPITRRRSSLGMIPAPLHATPPHSPRGGFVLKEGGEDLSPHADLHMDVQQSYSPHGRRSSTSLAIQSPSSRPMQSAGMQSPQSLRISGTGATSPMGFRRRTVDFGPAVQSAVAPGRRITGSETGLHPSRVPSRSNVRLSSETGISFGAVSPIHCHAPYRAESFAAGIHVTAHGRRSHDSPVIFNRPMMHSSINPSASTSNLISLPTLTGCSRRLSGAHPRQGSVTSMDSLSQSHDEASFTQQQRARRGGVMDMLVVSPNAQANRVADHTAMCVAVELTLNVADGLAPQQEQEQQQQRLTHGSAAQEPDGLLFMPCTQAASKSAQREACTVDAVPHQSPNFEACMRSMLDQPLAKKHETTSQFADLSVDLPLASQSLELVHPASKHLLLDQVEPQALSASKLKLADEANAIAARRQQQASNMAELGTQVRIQSSSVRAYSATSLRMEPDHELDEHYDDFDSERLSTGSRLSPASSLSQALARPVGEKASPTSGNLREAVRSSDGLQGHASGAHNYPGILAPAPPAHAPQSPSYPRQASAPADRPRVMRRATVADLAAAARGATGVLKRPPSRLATPSCLAAVVEGSTASSQSVMSPVPMDSSASLQDSGRPDTASNHSSGAVGDNTISTSSSSGCVSGVVAGAGVGVGPRRRPPGRAATFSVAPSMPQRPGAANVPSYSPQRVSFVETQDAALHIVTNSSKTNSQAQPGHSHNHSDDVDRASGNGKQQAAVAAPRSNSRTHSQSGIAPAPGDGPAAGSVLSAAAAGPFLHPYTALSRGSSLSIVLPGMSAGGGWEALSNGSSQSGLSPRSAAAGGGASTARGLSSMSNGGCALGLGGVATVSATVVVPGSNATSSHCNSPDISNSGHIGGGGPGGAGTAALQGQSSQSSRGRSSTITGGVTVQHPAAVQAARVNAGTDMPQVFKRRLPSRHASFSVLSTGVGQAKVPGHMPVDLGAAVAAAASARPDLASAGGGGGSGGGAGGGLLSSPRAASLRSSGYGAVPLVPTLSSSSLGLVSLPVSVAALRNGNATVAYASGPSHPYQHTHMHAQVHMHADGDGLQVGAAAAAQGVKSSLPAMLKRGSELYQVRR